MFVTEPGEGSSPCLIGAPGGSSHTFGLQLDQAGCQ